MDAFQRNKDKMQINETDPAAHLPIYMNLCEPRANESSARSEAAKQYKKKSVDQGEAEKKERGRDKPSNCDASNDARRAERPGQWSTGPSLAYPTFQQHRTTTTHLPPFFLATSGSPTSLSLATVINGSSSSHAQR